MKLLTDENIGLKVVEFLRSKGNRVLSKLLETYGQELKNKFVVTTEDTVRIKTP